MKVNMRDAQTFLGYFIYYFRHKRERVKSVFDNKRKLFPLRNVIYMRAVDINLPIFKIKRYPQTAQ